MRTYESLRDLQQKAAMKSMLEAKLDELYLQRRSYENEVLALRENYQEEQEDVEKLEGRSLARYFYNVIGKLDEKLDQERKEAYAVRVKLDAAERELEIIRRDVTEHKSLLNDAKLAQQIFSEEIAKKRESLKASDSEVGEQILDFEQKIADIEVRKQEIQEAIWAGNDAKSTADRILSKLESADGWNTWDMIGGGGIITHIAKHSHLDDAQDMVEELQSRLRKFKTELADVRIDANMQVNIDGFLRFADYFFDGLFADWAVGDRIKESMSTVENTKAQINRMIDKLRSMENAADQELANQKAALDELTVRYE